MDLNQVYKTLEEYREEMATSLSRLIAVPSIAVRTEGKSPFGENVQKVYDLMLEMAVDEGFIPRDMDGFGGHFDFPGAGDGVMGILAHLDVVPEGDDWDFDPYGGEIIDGYVTGRGATDDKGPLIACFYAMKALKKCGFTPDRTIRMILGLDEETEWEGMRHYVAFADQLPECGFTPDADFPVIHGEKGMLIFDIAKKFGRTTGEGLQLRSVTGGTAANCVADRARAVVSDTTKKKVDYNDIRTLVDEIAQDRGWKLATKGVGKSLEITSEGVSAHGSKPEDGLNAISIMMEVLGHLNFINDDVVEFIKFYNEHIGFEFNGEHVGCAFEDEQSGKLVWNTGMIDLDQKSVSLTINIRYPITCDEEQVYKGVMSVIDKYDSGIVKGRHESPIYIPADDPMVTKLMDIYRRHTRDEESEPMVIGGGTYARAMDNIIAFGARFPGRPELAHQKNEKISIDDLLLLSKIYAEAICMMAGEAQAEDAAPTGEIDPETSGEGDLETSGERDLGTSATEERDNDNDVHQA